MEIKYSICNKQKILKRENLYKNDQNLGGDRIAISLLSNWGALGSIQLTWLDWLVIAEKDQLYICLWATFYHFTINV